MDTVEFLNRHAGLAIWTAAIITITVGIMTVLTQRSINRRRATIDMFMQKIWDEDYLQASEAFADVMKDQTKLMTVHDMFIRSVELKRRNEWGKLSNLEKDDLEKAAATIYNVVRVLNDRELIAIGIQTAPMTRPYADGGGTRHSCGNGSYRARSSRASGPIRSWVPLRPHSPKCRSWRRDGSRRVRGRRTRRTSNYSAVEAWC